MNATIFQMSAFFVREEVVRGFARKQEIYEDEKKGCPRSVKKLLCDL